MLHLQKKVCGVLKSIAEQQGISCIADGVNLSDYEDFRPGIKACNEEGIWHPFVDAGITKEDIRSLAQSLGLAIWNKPSSACLSSRIPYGERITEENLGMVEEAEEYLKSLGIRAASGKGSRPDGTNRAAKAGYAKGIELQG